MERADPFSPAAAAAQIEGVRSHVEADRARFGVVAFPLALFGVISLVAAVIAATQPIETYALFWAFAGPLGGVTIGLWAWSTQVRWPFERPHAAAMITTAIGLVAGALVAGSGGSNEAPFLAVGSAYVLFAAFTGSRPTFLAAAAILVASCASYLGIPGIEELAVLTATVGLVQLVAAAFEVRIGRHRVQAALARTEP